MKKINDQKKEIEIKKSDGLEQVASLVHYVSATVPVFGGVLSSIFGGIAAGRKFERIKEVITKLADELKEIESISEEYIKSEDFEEILEQTLHKIAHERNSEKREIFKKFLKNTIASQLSYDDFVKYRILRTLEEVFPVHLYILKAISMEPNESETKGLISGKQIGTIIMRTKESGLTGKEIEKTIEDLNRLGITNLNMNILKTMTNVGEARDLRHTITDFGSDIDVIFR